MTKGSFHHHFAGIADYRGALLAHTRSGRRRHWPRRSRRATDAGTRATLAWLTALVAEDGATLRRPELDAAVRAWAHGDPEARATQARIDAAAIAALQATWRPAVESDAAARTAALVPYLVSLGAAAMVPPVEAAMNCGPCTELLLESVPADEA